LWWVLSTYGWLIQLNDPGFHKILTTKGRDSDQHVPYKLSLQEAAFPRVAPLPERASPERKGDMDSEIREENINHISIHGNGIFTDP